MCIRDRVKDLIYSKIKTLIPGTLLLEVAVITIFIDNIIIIIVVNITIVIINDINIFKNTLSLLLLVPPFQIFLFIFKLLSPFYAFHTENDKQQSIVELTITIYF